jgi:outer membrane receptor protein involved in Fe transport
MHFPIRKIGLLIGFCITAGRAYAADNDAAASSYDPLRITITKYFDIAREQLSPDTGSSTYDFSQSSIDNLPQGKDTPLNQVLLQAPGVAQDSYGQLHVRGDHSDLQYRINGIILPEGIAGFGQTLDTHFADKIDFMTGALPAQYGYRTAGVVNITTKSGAIENGGNSSVTAGGNQTFGSNQEFYGSQDRFSYYFTGDYNQNDRGIEPPTAAARAIHDYTQQDKEFGYMSYVPNPEHRLSLIFGNSTNRFQIPNNPGQPQVYDLAGTPDFPSADLNERQFEHNAYLVAALQGSASDKTDYQLALFSRYSDLLFKPDPLGDLIYNGVASRVYQTSLTDGIQNDYSYRINSDHTIRAGFTSSFENARNNTDSSVFSTLGPDCTTNPCTPFSIIDNHSKNATLFGAYLQDEWKAIDKLTINYGVRFDYYDAYVADNQISPRLGAVYELTPQTKLHAGYARYFTPPPTELIAPVTVSLFQNTTGAPNSTDASPVRPEKDDYFDAGIIQKIGTGLTLGVDAYYKQAHDLLDEGQFGQALIFAPFNYDKGKVHGIEFTADYTGGAFSSYANLALANAEGKRVTSGQFNFAQDELDYISSHWVHLDHDQKMTASVGASYTLYDVKWSADMVNGSGLRDGFANTSHLADYTQVNAAAEHAFDLGTAGLVSGRFSVINLFDRIYEIRDGSGIGVFAPQYGPRRTFLVTLGKEF